MKIKLLLILLFFTQLSFSYVKNYGVVLVNHYTRHISKEDILDNKQVCCHIKIKDLIIKTYLELQHIPSNFKAINIKLFHTILSRKRLKYEDLFIKK